MHSAPVFSTQLLLTFLVIKGESRDPELNRARRQVAVIGRLCSQSIDCGSSGAYCDSSKRCRCLSSYTDVNGYCWQKINPDQSGCQHSQQCSAVWPGSYCSSGTCRCANNQPGFLTRDGMVCVNYGQCPINGPYTQYPDFTCGTGTPVTDAICLENYDCICTTSTCTTTGGGRAGICCPSRALACIQPQDSGSGSGGSGFTTRYFYNSVTQNCETFTYFGAGGNANNFDTFEQCESYCKDTCPRGSPLYGNLVVVGPASKASITYCTRSTGSTTFCSNTQFECKQVGTQDICCPTVSFICSRLGGRTYAQDVAPTTNYDPGDQVPGRTTTYNRWYYDEGTRQCRTFTYFGYSGNFNNFFSQSHCESYCSKRLCDAGRPLSDGRGNNRDCGTGCPNGYECKNSVCCPTKQTVCKQPQSAGACFQFTKRWWFNSAAGQCEEFDYTGCQGNDNNFLTFDDCANFCEGISPEGLCPQGEAYRDSSGRYLVCNGASATVTTCPTNFICTFSGTVGGTAGTYSCCPTKAYTCGLTSDSGTSCLGTNVARWYYSTTNRRCETFTYYGCGGNSNNFATQQDCSEYCDTGGCPYGGTPFVQSNGAYLTCAASTFGGVAGTCSAGYFCTTVTVRIGVTTQTNNYCCPTRASVCTAPRLDGVSCLSQTVTRWYFNSMTRTCEQFQFRGCNGNRNNFPTRTSCLAYCNSADCPDGEVALQDIAGGTLTRCTVGSTCPDSRYTCVASSVYGGGVCCGSSAPSDSCPPGLTAWIDAIDNQPRTCTPNIGDCPSGYQCRYSGTRRQYYCCGTPANTVCPNGGSPYIPPGSGTPYPCLPTQPNSCVSIGTGYTCQARNIVINGVSSVAGTCCGAPAIQSVCGPGFTPRNDYTGQPARCHPVTYPNCPAPSTCRASPNAANVFYCCEGTGVQVNVCPAGFTALQFNGAPVVCTTGAVSANCQPPYTCQQSPTNFLFYCCQPGGSTGTGLCPITNQASRGACSPTQIGACNAFGVNYYCATLGAGRYGCCPTGANPPTPTQPPVGDPCPSQYRSPPNGRTPCTTGAQCAAGYYCVTTIQGQFCCGFGAVQPTNCDDGSQPATGSSCTAPGPNTGCPFGYICEQSRASAGRLQCCRQQQQQNDPHGCPLGRRASLYPGTQMPLSCQGASASCPNGGTCERSTRYNSNICCQV